MCDKVLWQCLVLGQQVGIHFYPVCGIDLICTVLKSLWYRQTLRRLHQKILLSVLLSLSEYELKKLCTRLRLYIWIGTEERTLSWFEERGSTTNFPITTPAVIYLPLSGSRLILHTTCKLWALMWKGFLHSPCAWSEFKQNLSLYLLVSEACPWFKHSRMENQCMPYLSKDWMNLLTVSITLFPLYL